MIQKIKLAGLETSFFFLSDFHWGHDRDFVWGKRGFKSVSESNDSLISRWNSTVSMNDTIFHLGDFIFGDPDGSKFRALVARLNFKHLYLLWGNHNSGQRQVYFEALEKQFGVGLGDVEVYPLTVDLGGRSITFLPALVNISINGKDIVLSHFPIRSHEGLTKGAIHLCGHSHGSCAMSNKNTGEGKVLDVGVESFGRPVSIDEIKRHLGPRQIVSVDHH